MKKLLFIAIIFAFFYSLFVDTAIKADKAINTYLFVSTLDNVEQADNTVIIEPRCLLCTVEQDYENISLSREFDYSSNKLLRNDILITQDINNHNGYTCLMPFFSPFKTVYIQSGICTSLCSNNRLKQAVLDNTSDLSALGRSP